MQILIRFAVMVMLSWLGAQAFAAGLMPTPRLSKVLIQSTVLPDPTGGYRYTYALTNPAQNTGEIYNVEIDIATTFPARMQTPSNGLSLSIGGDRYNFDSELAEVRTYPVWGPFLPALVPVGTTVPPGWNSGLSVAGTVAFFSAGRAERLKPGASMGGLELQSPGLPMIRDVQIVPWWIMIVADHDAVTQTEKEDAGQVEQDIIYKTVTLGPSGFGDNPGRFEHWNQLRDDLVRAIALGWFPETSFAADVTAQLSSARQALDQHDFYLVHQRLQALIDTLSAASPGKMTEEGYALIYYNVQAINQATSSNPIEPSVQINPTSTAYSLGSRHTQRATVLDLGNGSRPLPNMRVNFKVLAGPHVGMVDIDGVTDANGNVSVAYAGSKEGIDKLVVTVFYCGGECSKEVAALVRWLGGADLIVPFFIPPVLNTAAGKQILLSEGTKNIGNVAAPASITRYYLFPNESIDLNAAQFIGERNVPALQPGEMSKAINQAFIVPNSIPQGRHFLAACADADNAVVERNESNNCTYNPLNNYVNISIPLPSSSNQAPVCTAAKAAITYDKKGEHQIAKITVTGVTDPDGDVVSLKITAISVVAQSEGGYKKPTQLTGMGTSEVLVGVGEDEHATTYTLSFVAADNKGGDCHAEVVVQLGRTDKDDDEKGDDEDAHKKDSHDKGEEKQGDKKSS